MRSGWRIAMVAAVGVAAGCNQIAGIREGVPLGEEPAGTGAAGGTGGMAAECAAVADCAVEEPACRSAVGCEGGRCVFEDALEGTPLPVQTTGDCVELVCDGAGRAMVVARESDVPLDGNVCTLDACVGTMPQHTSVAQAPCYGGPLGTEGVGICKTGVQQCDGQGNPVGECVGDVLPTGEDCEMAGLDEDCDGIVNEVCCGDGVVSGWAGETCDDGGTSDGDNCSPTCQIQEVLEIAAGYSHTCALLSQGAVKCWGANFYGQLGLGDTADRGDGPGEMGDALPAVDLGSGKTATALVAGTSHTCALLDDGSVKCWGNNFNGQLGLGNNAHRGDGPGEMGNALPAVDLGSGQNAVALAAGSEHTCALLDDGSVKCWGHNPLGQLGLGHAANRGDGPGEMGINLPAVDLGSGKTATALSAGGHHTCARLNDGSMKCWGSNGFGGLGLGDTLGRGDAPGEMGDALPAVDLGNGKTVIALDGGMYHNCAILNDGSMKCWGINSGELGLGDTDHRGNAPGEMGDALPAVNLGTSKTAAALNLGSNHTCAILNDNSTKCWGRNGAGQLGLGDTLWRGDAPGEMGDVLPAVSLGNGKTAVALSADGDHTCARLSDGSAKCWGANYRGQLGLGDIADRGNAPGEMGDALPTVKLFSPSW